MQKSSTSCIFVYELSGIKPTKRIAPRHHVFRFAVICNAKVLWNCHVCLACFHMPTVRRSWPSCARTRDVTASLEASRGTRHLAGRQPRWCAAWRNRPAPLARWSQLGLRTNIVHSIWPPTRRRTTAWWCLRSSGCTGVRRPGCRRKQQGIRLASATDVSLASQANSTCQITDEAMAQGKELAPLNCADGRLKANTQRIKSLIESWDPRLLLSS